MANRPIPVEKAQALMQQYISYMTSLGVDPSQQTQTVSFNANDLQQWLNNVLPYTDEFRLCLGVYAPPNPNAGKITVVVWPYKNGQPATNTLGRGTEIEPFNEGQGQP